MPLQKRGDGAIALAIERGEDEDEHTQQETAHEPLTPVVGYLGQSGLGKPHGSGKEQRHQTREDAQNEVEWQVAHGEVAKGTGAELHIASHKEVGDGDGGYGRYEQWYHGGHGEVEHENLQSEDDTRNGGFEDTGYATSGATGHEEGHRLIVQLEEFGNVGADASTRECNRGLGTHRTAEADGKGAGEDRRVDVVFWQ